MAAEVFLSPGGRALENWRTAFPGLACLADAGQADAVMAPSAPSRVWVDVALPGWGEAVRTLAARGATVVVLSALPEGEQAVQALEAGGLNLDQSMRQWELGEALAKRAQSLLNEVKAKLDAAQAEQANSADTAGTQSNLD